MSESLAPSICTTATKPQVNTHTDEKVLDDGTRIIKTTTEIQQEHEFDHGGTVTTGSTTVTSQKTHVISTETVEEKVVGEELTIMDCFLFCCPCFKKCFGKKDEDDEENGGDSGGGKKSMWKTVEEK